MKNTLFHKVTALAIGSLLTFSSTAFASAYKIAEITHTARLGNSAILIAQRPGRITDVPAFSKSVALAETALGNAAAAAQSTALAGRGKSAVAASIAKATSALGNATALSGSTAISDKKAVARSLAQAETFIGDALAIAQSEAVSGPGKAAIATSLASAKTAMGNATAIATSYAQ
ncbi:hypothetical protein [Calothrix sp. NIES-2098]|uniref:hypothetical protein n=1 Tax=Calothrix sp. NIES-2098 TaxID=1954171 RepID=UPI000B60E9F0|nr:hypothetical protein NIES2098_51800 [Calothrix sp. NIES-2098]